MKTLFDPQRFAGQRIPLHVWADLQALEDSALQQAVRLTTLEFARHAAFMPDVHTGYGMPIGTAFAAQDVIVPYGVGNDIGCGVQARRLTLEAAALSRPSGAGTVLQGVMGAVLRAVPAGETRGQGAQADEQRWGAWDAVEAIPERAPHASASAELGRAHEGLRRATGAARRQLGTLGAGNHFLEIQADEDGLVWLMVHSGSRGLGGAVCAFYDRLAAHLTASWYATAGRKPNDLSFLPVGTPEGMAYLEAMDTCLRFARDNRTRMLDRAMEALGTTLGALGASETIDVHHNYAASETHFGKPYWVHRKGAVLAPQGQPVVIPGSMETASFVGIGRGEPKALRSCSHGAGRAMSRKAARAARTAQAVLEALRVAGIELATPNREAINDEGGHGYKSIDDVMRQQEDLVTPVHTLRPLGVVKG